MRLFRWSATGTILAAALPGALMLHAGPSPARTVGLLRDVGEPGYLVWYSFLLVEPLLLLVAAGVVRRTPWPWVGCATLQLVSAVGLAARLVEWVPGWAWPVLVASVGVGLASVAAALSVPSAPGRARVSRPLGGGL